MLQRDYSKAINQRIYSKNEGESVVNKTLTASFSICGERCITPSWLVLPPAPRINTTSPVFILIVSPSIISCEPGPWSVHIPLRGTQSTCHFGHCVPRRSVREAMTRFVPVIRACSIDIRRSGRRTRCGSKLYFQG